MPHAHAEPATVTIYHATAPTCWWSWGYEGTLNRIRALYGDQVDVRLLIGCVYEDVAEYLKENEMSWDEYMTWQREAVELMGVPLAPVPQKEMPKNMMPASYAATAANQQGAERGARFFRALLRRFNAEGQDVTRDEVLLAAAKEAGLDLAKFRRAVREKGARQKDMEHQGHGFPHLPMGYYNLAITDGQGRTVLIDHAFDPSLVEGAIDYLSGGKLKKTELPDILEYLRAHGPAPAGEMAHVMAWSLAETERKLAALASKGRVEKVQLAAGPHWQAAVR